MEKRRKDVFEERYSKFAEGLTKAVNEDLWEEIALVEDIEIDTSEFFDIYQEYLGDVFCFEME